LGRTKLYELIGTGHLTTTTVGRRRLVLVSSLQALLDVNPSEPGDRSTSRFVKLGHGCRLFPFQSAKWLGVTLWNRKPANHPTN
jgi:hypothetical protein